MSILRALRFSLLFLLGGCLPECNPKSACEPSESHCEGSVAVVCRSAGEPGDPFHGEFQFARTTCESPFRCVNTTNDAVCALAAEPCDPRSFDQRCLAGRPVVCQSTSNYEAVSHVQQFGPACAQGNVCVAGGCGLPADTTCDPATHAPTCEQGKPVICDRMGELDSDRFRLTYPEPPCADGNRCVVGDGYVGCGRGETTCDPNAAADRCDGTTLVRCRVVYARVGVPRIGLEYQIPCARGCSAGPGGARCVE